MAKKPSKPKMFPERKKRLTREERADQKRMQEKFAPDYASERRFMTIRTPQGDIIEPNQGG